MQLYLTYIGRHIGQKRTGEVQLVQTCVALDLACFSEQPRLMQSNTVCVRALTNNTLIQSYVPVRSVKLYRYRRERMCGLLELT